MTLIQFLGQEGSLRFLLDMFFQFGSFFGLVFVGVFFLTQTDLLFFFAQLQSKIQLNVQK